MKLQVELGMCTLVYSKFSSVKMKGHLLLGNHHHADDDFHVKDYHNDNYHDNHKANLGPGFCSCLVHSQHAGSAGQVA